MTPGPHDGDAIAASLAAVDAFAPVFDRHYGPIWRFVARRVGADLADDVTATVFEAAFTGRHRFDTARADAAPWLYGIATNVVRRHHRSEQRRLRAIGRLDRRSEAASGCTDDLDDLVDLARAVARLGRHEREALLLHAWADLSYDEVAMALDVPVGTVRSRISRARARLRVSAVPAESAVPTESAESAQSTQSVTPFPVPLEETS